MRLPILLLLLIPGLALGARPMQTDDARIVDAKACQLESWLRADTHSTQLWALPGCNLSGNLELTFGGALTRNQGSDAELSDRVFQAKTIFRTLQTNDWAWGLAAGINPHPNLPSRSRNDVYTYVPVTLSFDSDRTLLHLNGGVTRVKAESRTYLTWGSGIERQLNDDIWLVGEVFGRNEGKPYFQLGLRRWLLRDRVQLDMTYGDRFGSSAQEQRWFTIGLRLLSVPFLP